MDWPQGAMIMLAGANIVWSWVCHGETDRVSFGESAFSWAIVWWLLWMGGFWS